MFDLENGILSTEYLVMILMGIVTGTIARVITLVIDYRQVPSYPNGQFIHLVAGLVASALGAVAIPALIEKDFTAITFIALATQHFRDIRKIERESYAKLEHSQFTKRGDAYIDGISKTFEARNYISLITAVITVLAIRLVNTQSLVVNILLGLGVGLACTFLLKHYTKGKTVGDISTVKQGTITVEGSELYVDGMFVSSILGMNRSRELFFKEGLALVVEPKKPIFRLTLENFGQRQAMLFEAVRALGVKRYRFTRRSFSQGKIVIALVPLVADIDTLIQAVRNTPILENSRKIHRIMKTKADTHGT